MRLSTRRTPLLPLLLLGAASLSAPAQEPPAAEFSEQVSVGWVSVPVLVRAGAGYANNLDTNDFRVLVDGRRVYIESFERRADAPASLVFLQDLSGSMAGAKLEASRQVVRFFLDRALRGDEFAIATFAGDETRVEVPFTSDTTAAREAVDSWRAYGTTALHDAVAQVPDISFTGRNPKRFAILITDGVDNASRIPPERARELVRAAQVPFYVLGLNSGSPFEVSAEGKKVYRYADVLNLLAVTSGGRYYPISGPEDQKKALDAIAEDLRHQYVLGFSTAEGKPAYRDLRVEVKGRNRTVTFRHGYKGPPPARFEDG
jgi:VWFA-related protein